MGVAGPGGGVADSIRGVARAAGVFLRASARPEGGGISRFDPALFELAQLVTSNATIRYGMIFNTSKDSTMDDFVLRRIQRIYCKLELETATSGFPDVKKKSRKFICRALNRSCPPFRANHLSVILAPP